MASERNELQPMVLYPLKTSFPFQNGGESGAVTQRVHQLGILVPEETTRGRTIQPNNCTVTNTPPSSTSTTTKDRRTRRGREVVLDNT